MYEVSKYLLFVGCLMYTCYLGENTTLVIHRCQFGLVDVDSETGSFAEVTVPSWTFVIPVGHWKLYCYINLLLRNGLVVFRRSWKLQEQYTAIQYVEQCMSCRR